jgi:hypothetical protein
MNKSSDSLNKLKQACPFVWLVAYRRPQSVDPLPETSVQILNFRIQIAGFYDFLVNHIECFKQLAVVWHSPFELE